MGRAVALVISRKLIHMTDIDEEIKTRIHLVCSTDAVPDLDDDGSILAGQKFGKSCNRGVVKGDSDRQLDAKRGV